MGGAYTAMRQNPDLTVARHTHMRYTQCTFYFKHKTGQKIFLHTQSVRFYTHSVVKKNDNFWSGSEWRENFFPRIKYCKEYESDDSTKSGRLVIASCPVFVGV